MHLCTTGYSTVIIGLNPCHGLSFRTPSKSLAFALKIKNCYTSDTTDADHWIQDYLGGSEETKP